MSGMSHRHRPGHDHRHDVDRARRHLFRAPGLTPCPLCRHPRSAHAIEDGHPVCTRGAGHRVACRHCAELQARLPMTAMVTELRRAFARPPLPTSLVLTGDAA
jgi:hypothetical protein